MAAPGLKRRILVPLAWALVPTLVVLLAVGVFHWQNEMHRLEDDQRAVARQAALHEQLLVAEARAATEALAAWAAGHGGPAPGMDCAGVLANVARERPGLTNLGLLDPSGALVCSLDAGVPDNVHLRPVWSTLQSRGGFAVAEYEWRPDGIADRLVFVHAVDADGFGGAAFAMMPPTHLAATIQADLGAAAELVVVDADGRILATDAAHQRLIGYRIFKSALIEAMLEQDHGEVELMGLDPNRPLLWTFAPLEGTEGRPVRVAVGIDPAPARTEAAAALGINLAGAAALVLGAGLVATLALDRYVVRQVRRLAQAAEQPLDEAERPPAAGVREIDELRDALFAARDRVVEELAARARQQEALERTNEELERFAYVASHDLREPLRKVDSFLALLEEECGDGLSDDGRIYVERARASAVRMQVLVRELLDYSRLSSAPQHTQGVDLDRACRNALANLSTLVQERGADVRVDPLPRVRGNPVTLEQVFQNLLENALKYHRPSEPPRVHVGADPHADGRMRVWVRDHGVGVPPEHRERVFQPFQRLHGRDVPGTGIGLASCKRIVEQHGGSVRIEDPDGAGTRFVLTLPVEP